MQSQVSYVHLHVLLTSLFARVFTRMHACAILCIYCYRSSLVYVPQLKQATEEYSAYKCEAECRRAKLQGQLHDVETSFMTTSSRLKLKESAFDVLTADATGLQTQVNSLREEVTRVSSRLQHATKELEEKRSVLARETSSLQDTKVGVEGTHREGRAEV